MPPIRAPPNPAPSSTTGNYPRQQGKSPMSKTTTIRLGRILLAAGLTFIAIYAFLFAYLGLGGVCRGSITIYPVLGPTADVIRFALRHGVTALFLVLAVFLLTPQLRALRTNTGPLQVLDHDGHLFLPIAFVFSIAWSYTGNTMSDTITLAVLSRDFTEHIQHLFEATAGATYLVTPSRASSITSGVFALLSIYVRWRKLRLAAVQHAASTDPLPTDQVEPVTLPRD